MSCETSFCDNKNSLLNKNLLLGNYLIKFHTWVYLRGKRLHLIFDELYLASEKECLTESVNPWRQSLGREGATGNVQNPRGHSVLLVLVAHRDAPVSPFLYYVHISCIWVRLDEPGGCPRSVKGTLRERVGLLEVWEMGFQVILPLYKQEDRTHRVGMSSLGR